MFREALDYPTRPPVGARSVVAGGLLLLVVGSFVALAGLQVATAPLILLAVVPWLLVRGYYVRVVRTTIGRTEPVPPPFGRPRELLADGVRAVAISVAYLLPAAIVIGPLVAVSAAEADLGTLLGEVGIAPIYADVVIVVAGVLAVVALLYLVGALYALPIAVANFAYTGRVAAAFERRTVFAGALSEDYAVAWAVSLLLQALLLPVAYLLRIVLVGFFLQFLVAMGVRYCYGQGYGTALGRPPVPLGVDHPAWTDLTPAVRRPEGSGVATRADRVDGDVPRPAVVRVDGRSTVEWSSRDDPGADSTGGGGPDGVPDDAVDRGSQTERR